MSRYTDEELTTLKRSVDLSALVRAKGIELKPHGSKDLIGRCPFHKDESPSFVVTPEKNLFHCLGCGAGGSVINFIMEHDKLSFRHAVEVLREDKIPKLLKKTALKSQRATTPCLDSPVEADANDHELMDKVISYYHERLQTDPTALNYLKKRGIDKPELIKHFGIGYADRTLGFRLPLKNRVDGKQIRERLTALGLYRESGHEHFNGCLVFPVKDEQGNTTEIYGRKVCQKQKTGIYHLYLPGPHLGIFNRECFDNSREIILCESVIDSLTFWANGFKNTTCIYGTEGFTEELLEALKRHKIQKVYLAYDRDEAGDRATQRDAKKLSAIGIECYRIQFPHSMDANAYACKEASATQSLAALIRGAEWLKNGGACTDPLSTATLLAANDAEMAAKEKMGADSPGEESSVKLETLNTTPELASTPKPNVEVKTEGKDLFIAIGDRLYRVRGLAKNSAREVLKVNLRAQYQTLFHLDMVDFYSAKSRSNFENSAASELTLKPELIKKDLGKLLLKLEELQEQRFKKQEIAKLSQGMANETPQVSPAQREQALELLKDPKLLERILEDFKSCGLVGEQTNMLTGYLATVSRKLRKPLAVIIQSNSAAGKTTLMEAILNFLPPEEQIKYSAMTSQSLYYLGENDLKHKILAIVEEEGAEKASYALKLLQSEGELRIASTGKNPTTGRMQTEEYHLEGPVMIFLTTTSIDVDEELLNRCILLSVDESRAQTLAIHDFQRDAETLEGLQRKIKQKSCIQTHRNAQRLLRPIEVVNPYAPHLKFLSSSTQTRRDNLKYLTLIRTIALLHQYQRPLKKTGDIEYIEVSLEDIKAANKIAKEIFARSLDELPPQTRQLYTRLAAWLKEQSKSRKIDIDQIIFTRRQVRSFAGCSHTQVKIHLDRLEEMEYIERKRGSFGMTYEYTMVCSVTEQETDWQMLENLNLHIYDANLKAKPAHLQGPEKS